MSVSKIGEQYASDSSDQLRIKFRAILQEKSSASESQVSAMPNRCLSLHVADVVN